MAKRYKIYRGDTLALTLPVTLDGLPYDITNAELFFTVKKNPKDDDVDALTQKVTGSGITHVNPVGGIAQVVVTDAETILWPLNRALSYDVQIKTQGLEIYTLEAGYITVLQDITVTTT